MKKLERKELVQWAANKACMNPLVKRGEKYEVGWGEKRRDYKETPCGKCIPCRAKRELGIELKTKEYTR